MTPDEFRNLLFSPEVIVVELVGAALVALERALRVEHPLLDAPPPTEHPPIRRQARAVLRRARRLRDALQVYRDAVNDILLEAQEKDLPF
jgi:hypothetical protein